MFIGGVIKLSVKLAWSVVKVIFTIAGSLIVGALLFSGGFVIVAFVLLIIGIISLLAAAVTA
jgi:hypothetical protein